VQLLKINGYSAASSTCSNNYSIVPRWHVDGYDWEIRIYPDYIIYPSGDSFVSLQLFFLSESRSGTYVRASLGCRLIDPRGILKPSEEKSEFRSFFPSGDYTSTMLLIQREDLLSSGYVQDDAFTLQCTITVLKDIPVQTFPVKEAVVHAPPSNLHQQFGELLQSEAGADVMFVVSGETFAAHKLILAARSPVFMAQFYGQMMEKSGGVQGAARFHLHRHGARV
jgi:speckle-type POZ protein